jgi:hypothetical protein
MLDPELKINCRHSMTLNAIQSCLCVFGSLPLLTIVGMEKRIVF